MTEVQVLSSDLTDLIRSLRPLAEVSDVAETMTAALVGIEEQLERLNDNLEAAFRLPTLAPKEGVES